MQTTQHAPSDADAILRLNDDYIASVRTSDVERFEEILAGDFLCSLPDGALIDRSLFLERTAKTTGVVDLQAHDVKVRMMGDVAIVHGATTYSRPDGSPASGRYTDVWARRNGQWVAVSAHVTRG